MRVFIRNLFYAGLFVSCAGGVANAQTFDFSGGTQLTGLVNAIPVRANSGNSVGTISALVFDPTSQVDGEYNRIYFTNRQQTSGTNKGGLYVTDTVTKAVSFIGLQSNADNDNLNPSSVTIDDAGTVYVGRDVSAQLWRVNSPLSSPTFTQMLGNYGASAADDDPISINWVPSTNQIMVFDQGLDNDLPVAISLVDAGSTSAAPSYTTIWTTTPATNNNISGDFSVVDNHGYFAYATSPIVDGLAAIYRVDLAGNLDTILLDGIDSELVLDNSVAVNPADGSVWLPIITPNLPATEDTPATTNNRTYYRVDVASATLQSPGVYLAATTAEFKASGFNAGINSVTFSPDGRWLAVGVPDGNDVIHLLEMTAPIPEPATLALAGIAMFGCVTASRRRR